MSHYVGCIPLILASLSIMPLRFPYGTVCINSSLLSAAGQCHCRYTTVCFISSPTEGDLGVDGFRLSQIMLLWTFVFRLWPHWFCPTRKIWWNQWKPRERKIKCASGKRCLPLRDACKDLPVTSPGKTSSERKQEVGPEGSPEVSRDICPTDYSGVVATFVGSRHLGREVSGLKWGDRAQGEVGPWQNGWAC